MTDKSAFCKYLGKAALTVLLLAVTAALSGCFNIWPNGPDVVKGPFIAGVEPPDHAIPPHYIGISGQPVTFEPHTSWRGDEAQTDWPTGGLTEWTWDFGGGAIPNTSHEFNPTVTLGAPGTYEGHVVVHVAAYPGDNPNLQQTFTYDVAVSWPPALQ